MRSIPAILATLAIASIGAQALLPPEQPTRRAYTSSAISSSTTPPYHPPEPTKPATTTTTKTTSKSAESYKPEPTSTYTPEHPKPSDKPDPEYEKFCQTFAFFHGWDLDCGDLPSGSTAGKYIYECAEDCLVNKDCDATVSFDGYCYPKTLDDFQPAKLVKKEYRDMGILGSCEDLQKLYEETKCYPDGFLDCCYDKNICVEVYKDGSKKW